jgi:hypothetical protein
MCKPFASYCPKTAIDVRRSAWGYWLVAEVSITEQSRRQGQRLRALRERLGISKGMLMDRLGFRHLAGLSTSTRRGGRVIRLDLLETWAAAYGLSVQAFVAEIVSASRTPTRRA